MSVCAICKTPHATIYKEAPGKGMLCEGCHGAWESEQLAEANKPSKAQLAIWAEQDRRLKEYQAAMDQRPNDPHFCTHKDSHRDTSLQAGRKAVGFNERGELCCEECLPPELNPAKLAERLAALEQAVAALQAGKPTVKGRAAG